VNDIHTFLRQTNDEIENNRLPLSEFVITKGLTKGPEEYSDAKSQPHVQVALKMKAQGKPMRAGDHIPYVICADPSVSSFAQRAHDPEAVEAAAGKLVLDKKWYMESQLHPVVSRICAVIQGTDSGQLADCLGLDSSKFHKSDNAGDSERKSAFSQQQESADRFENVEKFSAMCTDGLCREFPGVYVMDKMGLLRCGLRETDTPGVTFNPSAMRLQLGHLFRKCLSKYHDGWLVCGDDTCAHRTRNVLCDVYRDGEQVAYGLKCPAQGCSGKMQVEYSSEQLYLQTLYLKQLFDVSHAERKLSDENVSRTQRGLLPLKPPTLEDTDQVSSLPCV